MTQTLIIEKAIEEVEKQTFGVTKQFLKVHSVVYADNKPKIVRVDTEKEDEAVVYFAVEKQNFFLAIYLGTKPNVSVRWTDTVPYHSISFRAFSEQLTFEELSALTILKSTGGNNKGDKKRPNSDVLWKESSIEFRPNPEADEFENKLTALLNYLEQDKAGVEKLVNTANGYIQVNSSFHNGNTLIGGGHIGKE